MNFTIIKTILLTAVLSATTSPLVARAEEDTSSGNFWLAQCSGAQNQKWFCYGYIQGMMDGYRQGIVTGAIAGNLTGAQFERAQAFCIPDQVTVGQATDVFVQYLTKHPESRHNAASGLYMKAMSAAFPCHR